jgi:acyl carrier protein
MSYDAIIHIGTQVETAPVEKWIDWNQNLSVAELRRKLEAGKPESLGLRHVQIARLQQQIKMLDLLLTNPPATVGELKQNVPCHDGIEVEDLYEIGEKCGYSTVVRIGKDGTADVAYTRGPALPIFPESESLSRELNDYAKKPVHEVAVNLRAQLRAYVHEKLPDYMAPSAYVILETLPQTANGKVDRKALPAPEGGREREQSFVAPRNAREQMLAEVWSSVLGVEPIGAHDNFFELGGHSLHAIQVVSRLRDSLQIELPFRSFFETPTLSGLAVTIDTLCWAAQGAPSSSRIEGELEEIEV